MILLDLVNDFEKIIKADPKAKVISVFNLDPPAMVDATISGSSRHLPGTGLNFSPMLASEIWRGKKQRGNSVTVWIGF